MPALELDHAHTPPALVVPPAQPALDPVIPVVVVVPAPHALDVPTHPAPPALVVDVDEDEPVNPLISRRRRKTFHLLITDGSL